MIHTIKSGLTMSSQSVCGRTRDRNRRLSVLHQLIESEDEEEEEGSDQSLSI